jgi:hypothetical protein
MRSVSLRDAYKLNNELIVKLITFHLIILIHNMKSLKISDIFVFVHNIFRGR